MFEPPQAPPVSEDALDALARLLAGRKVCVLTGAGCSTEAGIPDYRSPAQRARVRTPLSHQEFVRSPRLRARYWCRSLLGWPRFATVSPATPHRALAALEAAGCVGGLITQNVDRLHHRAGSGNVIELHGALERVRCLDCGEVTPRASLQARLFALNPDFARPDTFEVRPDGDAELPAEVEERFVVPPCEACSGVLKPDVVFFGDNVPPEVVAAAFAQVESARALLVCGSSLHVYSGFRFVRRASELGLPIAVVNVGETRGDALATFRIEGRVGEVLERVAQRLV